MEFTLVYRIDGEERTDRIPSFPSPTFFAADRISGSGPESPAVLERNDYGLSVRSNGIRTSVRIFAEKPLVLVRAAISEEHRFRGDEKFYVNGYQSWTDTREFGFREELHNMNRVPEFLKRRYHFPAYGDAWFRTYRRGVLHGFSFAYLRDPRDGSADLIGSYNEENAYLVILYGKKEQRITLESDCGGRRVEGEFPLFDYVCLHGDPGEVLKQYFRAYGTCAAEPVRGYTSWYNDYQDISSQKIHRAINAAEEGGFDLFQIDDGYETFVGDWMDVDPVKFPDGLAPAVEEIRRKGMRAGIWLAPFVCETKSRLFREHPDWIYRENGEPVFAGCNWSGDAVLDIRKKEVQEYLRECLNFFLDMGFRFFKLDFLYAAALIRDERFTRAEIMRAAMKGLRGILGDAEILGCGVPLSSAFSLVDYCRIGPDVSLAFDDVFFMRMMHRERISTKNTIPNTIFRSSMDGTVFRCDPDVYLLRDDNLKLTKAQREALVLLNHLCGSVFMTSDDIASYDAEKRALLNRARTLTEACVTEIESDGPRIRIRYVLSGNEKEIVYDRERGVILHE